ncbi:MAG: hypothetical protein A2X36_06545 [Elusimicrobia bacterium GWA2_69_24]|nr:MAG: hypothetical protein A2X36_06545 [Elusimicrobia bacterium GWA2_69_24]HBL17952.1 hypothetical protein [Elusimicrobiota bacterium]
MADQERQSSSAWLFALLPLAILGGFIFVYIQRQGEEPLPAKTPEVSEFNLPEAPEVKPDDPLTRELAPVVPSGPTPEAAPPKGPGLSGFVAETDGMFSRDPKAIAEAKREGEKEFIKKYDPAIRKEQERLSRIGAKYYKKYAVVREVDAAFGSLPRYMALKQQYNKDRDAYEWARKTVALPEVRDMIRKYALKPDVWKAAVEMSLEGVKQTPPKPVYDEMVRFLTSDKSVGDFIGKFTKWMTPKVPGILTQGAIPPGVDLAPLQNIMSEVAPGAATSGGSSSRKPASRR